jgi:signal transduction histidine kinase
MFNFLRKIPLFSEMPEDDLWQLCGLIETVNISAGEVLFEEDSPGDRAYVIKQGELEIVKSGADGEMLLAVRSTGEVIGEMALLEENPRMAGVRARTDSTLFTITKEQLDDLIASSPSAAQALFKTILARWRSTQGKLRQSEKMAQLGTMTAGVAHELNNPAAAVKRAAGQLDEALERFIQAQAGLKDMRFSAGQETIISQAYTLAKESAASPPQIDSLARSDSQEEMEDWLYERGIDEPWELAPVLVDMSLTVPELQKMMSAFEAGQFSYILGWMCAVYSVNSLVRSVGLGAGRISEIVKALKSYAYLDQAPVQNLDIHQGLDDTLVILGSKLKSGITVTKEYAPDLLLIQAYGSELNQVWTNLIDNAIDAMDGEGELTLRTHKDEDWVVVEIEDSGEGIPEEVQPKIFDPFFTTKPPGVGTGLGLDISYNIVVQKHRGNLKFNSQPGKTIFEVWLPVNFEEKSGENR